MRRLPNSKGFTLQELLITMMIISILSIIGFTTFRTIQLKGRDQRRKQDIQSISSALQLYFLTNKRYPCQQPLEVTSLSIPADRFWLKDNAVSCPSVTASAFDATYITSEPIDPINNINFHYSYNGVTAVANTYRLCARMESTSESLSDTIVDGGDPNKCGGSSGWHYYFLINP